MVCKGKRTIGVLAIIFIASFFMATAALAAQMGVVDTSAAHVAKLGKLIHKLKGADKSIVEITVHATGKDGNTSRIVSTTAGLAGTPSDPEDIDAIIDNQVVVISEGGTLDVTVPMANSQGMPAAVAGIRVSLAGGLSKEEARAKAVKLARRIDQVLVQK